MALKITDVRDAGDDVLYVRAVDGDNEYVARGWVSATTNHFRPGDYDSDGNRKQNAKPKKMTKAEKNEYVQRLLREQNPGVG